MSGRNSRGRGGGGGGGGGKGKGEGEGVFKEKGGLNPDDKISESLHLKEPEPQNCGVRVLVQLPARAEGTSCCAVSTRCQLI